MALLMLLSRYNMIRKHQDMVVPPPTPAPPCSHYLNSNDFILAKDGRRRAFPQSKWHQHGWSLYKRLLSRQHKVGDFALREYVSFLFYFFLSFFLDNFCLACSSFPKVFYFNSARLCVHQSFRCRGWAVAIKEDRAKCKAWEWELKNSGPPGRCQSMQWCWGHRAGGIRSCDM